MNKHFGSASLALALVMVLSVLAAQCPPPATPTTAPEPTKPAAQLTKAPEATKAPEPTKAAAKVKLQLLGWSSSDAENEMLTQIIKDFNASQDKYEAAFTPVTKYDETLQTSLAGGSPPDLFYLDAGRFADFYKNKALKAMKIQDPDDFYPALRAGFTADGTFYAPPKDFSTLALIYNKKMLQAASVAVPTTWDELQAAAKKLTDKSKGVYGLSLSPSADRWMAFLYQAGGHIINAQGKMDINTPEAKKALEFYTNLYLDGYAVKPAQVDTGWNGEAFGKEKVAMVVEGNWIVPYLKRDFPQVEFGIAELPAGPAGKGTLAFTVAYAVAANAKNPEGSEALLNYLTGKEGMQKWTDLGLAMPTRKSLRQHWVDKFPELGVFLAGAEYAHVWQFPAGFQPVLDTLNSGIEEIIGGQKTAAQVLADTQKAGEEVLK